MAYIGRNPAIGTQKVLDSLESQFNGTLTTFDLRYNGVPTYPTISSSLIVSLGGVLQEPGEAYYVSSDSIVFASAPPTGADCWILLYSEYGAAAGSGSSGGAVSVATGEPMGYEERTDSDISFNDATRTFTVEPASAVSEFVVWTKGTKRTYSTAQTVQIGTTTGLYYIYFDAFGVLQYRTTYFIWDEDTPTAYVYWNATTSSAVFVADERHGIVLDWQTHEYLHRTRGAVIANGFSISNYTTTGDGSADSDAQFDLGNGTFFDEDLEVSITHSATPSVGTFTQVLTGNAEIPVYYMSGSEGDWVKDTATEFACKQSGTTLQYNSLSGSTWSTTAANDNRYVVSWVVATNEINAPIIVILGQDQYSAIGTAEEAVWGDLTLTNFPIFEFRPLWKVIFRTNSTYTNAPNAYIANVLDLREFSSTGIAGTIVNDHGLLSGLTDDDHSQYLNTTIDRTGVTANISTTGNITGANLIATGQLQGPANFVIDPAAIGDDTGNVEIKGNLTVQGTTTTINSTTVDLDHLSLGDDEIANFGDGNDLQIYHDSTGSGISYIKDAGPGALRVVTNTLRVRPSSDAGQMANFIESGAVELYYDNSKKIETTNTGIDVTGHTETDTLGVSGVSTFQDNVKLTTDNRKLIFGNNDDLEIFHDGSNNYIVANSGSFNIKSPSFNYIKTSFSTGRVQLYYGNSPKFETTGAGVTVTGALEVSAATNITVGGTALPSLTGLLGGSLDGTLGTVTMAYLPAAPNSPVQGQFYFNSLNQKAQIYTGSTFVDLVPSGGGGGGGAGTTDAQSTFRKYTYSITSTTNAVSGSSDTVVTAGDFVVGNVYTIKTIGTTDFTAIGASANTVGVEFTATGAGTGTGDAYDTLYYATGGIQNIEVYVNGVKSVEGSTNDYVATTGTSVNFTANLASGDVVDIQVYELLTNDAYVLASGGTFTGNVGINTSTINNRLHIHSDANGQGILLTQGGSNYNSIVADADRTAADLYILEILANWNGTNAARITLESGDDTTNKDDGRIKFSTSAAGGSLNVAMRIDPDGNVGIGGDHAPLNPLHIKADDATLLRLERDGTVNAGIRYENDISQMFAGLSSSATFFGVGPSENIGSAATQFAVMRATGNVGIGDTDPISKLEVVGDITITNGDQNNAIRTNAAGQLQFLRNAPANNTVAVTIDDDTGNVGIGTENPTTELDVYSSTFADVTISSARTTGNIGGFNFRKDVGGTPAVMAQMFVTTEGHYNFRAGGNNSSDHAFRINANGNTGIGTESPVEKLHVEGNIYFNNNAIISSYDGAGTGGSNIDHLWHNDDAEFGTAGSWVFNSDTTYKSETSGTFSNIKVGHVYVDNGSLGTTAGDTQDLAKFYAGNGNATSIRIQAKRKVAGNNWNSAGYKIFCHTDATEQGYIEFNPHTTTSGDGNYDVAIGSRFGELVRFENTGNVGIGTLTPQEKLHIEGNIQINDVKMGALVTPVINDDAYYDVTVPNTAGLLIITPFSGSGFPDYPQPQGSGMVWYDVGLSRNAYLINSFSGATLEVLTNTTSTTVTDMTDGALTVAPLNSTTNVLRLFNRVGGTNSGQRKYKLVFL